MKLILSAVGNIIDATTAQTTINNNNAAIVNALENTLSRDGSTPNAMTSQLDMNGQKIINVADALNPRDAVNLETAMSLFTGGTPVNPAVTVDGVQTLTNKTLTSPVITTPTGLVPNDIGLGNVNNTSDINKPVSTAQAAAIAASTATVTKTSIGLGNVDNTSDVNKPVSTAQASAIAASTATVTKTSIGLGNVDNTSDLNKLVSTATTAAIAASTATVTKTSIGLSNVPNVDATNATNITTGTLAAARVATIPSTQISGLGTMAAQNTSNYVPISGGAFTGTVTTPVLNTAGMSLTASGSYAQAFSINNAGVTNGNKYFRMNPSGALEIIDSGYTQAIHTFSNNGDFAAVGNVTAGVALYAPIFYDSNNAGYYCDPHATSHFNGLNTDSNITVGGGTTLTGNQILTSNNSVFYVNNGSTGQVRIAEGGGGCYFGSPIYSAASITASYAGAQIIINATSGNPNLIFNNAGTANWRIEAQTGPFYIFNSGTTSGVQLVNQSATSWTAFSDIRLKDNVTKLSVLDKLDSYQAIGYTFKPTGVREIGVSAQDLYKIYPELVNKGTEGEDTPELTDAWGVSYDRLGAIALQGVKELRDELVALRAELKRAA